MNEVSRLERLQWRDGAHLDDWERQLADHRRLQPEKYVYASYKRFGTTHAVIAFLEGRVAFYRNRIARRAERIRRAKANVAA